MYFRTPDGRAGWAKFARASRWGFAGRGRQSLTMQQRIDDLFDALGKQIRVGWFEVPNVLARGAEVMLASCLTFAVPRHRRGPGADSGSSHGAPSRVPARVRLPSGGEEDARRSHGVATSSESRNAAVRVCRRRAVGLYKTCKSRLLSSCKAQCRGPGRAAVERRFATPTRSSTSPRSSWTPRCSRRRSSLDRSNCR